MANFYIRGRVNIQPIEEVLFADGTTKSRQVHSTIDKTFASAFEFNVGTTAADIKFAQYTIPDTALKSLKTVLSAGAGDDGRQVVFVYIKLVTLVGTSGLTIKTTADTSGVGDIDAELKREGDFMLWLPYSASLTEHRNIWLAAGTGSNGSIIDVVAGYGTIS